MYRTNIYIYIYICICVFRRILKDYFKFIIKRSLCNIDFDVLNLDRRENQRTNYDYPSNLLGKFKLVQLDSHSQKYSLAIWNESNFPLMTYHTSTALFLVRWHEFSSFLFLGSQRLVATGYDRPLWSTKAVQLEVMMQSHSFQGLQRLVLVFG